MKAIKKYLAMLATPDRIMDVAVRNRWDTKDNPASDNSLEPYYFDRSGALKINPRNEEVQKAFLYNINALSTKKHNHQG
ncbi:Uncharacterised protein [Serratia marcescens]|uniref:hypothetical protein n=1 Tax=Serratia marcescens TaxID=615 RepID=UPI0007453EA4|nr:hypothetical protein [Serratia marcescens]CUZ74046.1 Uncharacterised protein [Serratia marcescens]HEJ7815252.1 hypothetical protein [Serratia marcescens]